MMRLSVGMRKMVCVATVDFICIAIVAVPCLLLNLVGEPYMRGFFCDDESIRHPYLDSSVPTWALILISYSLPAIIIALVETAFLKHSESFTGPRLAREMYNTFGLFMFGSMVNQLLTDTSKFTIGRLRPHFMEVCNPDINLTEAVCGPPDAPVFVTNFTCLGQTGISDSERSMRMHDMRLSWVSGHASLSAYSMWFCIVFLHQRMSTRNFRLVRPLIQVGCALFAVFTSLTRVSDYKHHAEDVASGALLGLIVASLTVTFLLKNKDGKRTRATSVTSLLNVTTTSGRMAYTDNNISP